MNIYPEITAYYAAMEHRQTHRHMAESSQEVCFSGSVNKRGTDENPMAHGNICVIETCACGATRRTNVNGRHTEEGDWEK